jgi:hypothetical protein
MIRPSSVPTAEPESGPLSPSGNGSERKHARSEADDPADYQRRLLRWSMSQRRGAWHWACTAHRVASLAIPEVIPTTLRHLTDRAGLSASHDALRQKYGWELPVSRLGKALTLPEQATFELIAAA